MVTKQDVKDTIEYYLKNFKDDHKYVEVAFFGGSFTAIEKEKQEELLKVGKDENKIAEIGEAIMKLREERQQVMTDAAMHKDVTDRIEDLSNFLDEQTGAITEYSDALVRRLIEKITVYDEALVVKFKSGLEITVDA